MLKNINPSTDTSPGSISHLRTITMTCVSAWGHDPSSARSSNPPFGFAVGRASVVVAAAMARSVIV